MGVRIKKICERCHNARNNTVIVKGMLVCYECKMAILSKIPTWTLKPKSI